MQTRATVCGCIVDCPWSKGFACIDRVTGDKWKIVAEEKADGKEEEEPGEEDGW